MNNPLITIAVPSLNQGSYLNAALESIFQQDLPVEVFVMDGGSTDDSLEIIKQWESQLAGWRSHPDEGQAAAINEGIAQGTAPYVCWLNSDDLYYPGGLKKMLATLQAEDQAPFVYGRCWTISASGKKLLPYLTMPFIPWLFANFCFIAQPATLIKRTAWDSVGGLNESMQMAFDYDLWWRLFKSYNFTKYLREFVAATRAHKDTKTSNYTELHYQESVEVVRVNWGSIPKKWKLTLPILKLIRKLVN
ncbi:MAG: glycosyltransferase [Xanthomonadales bacterium]|nr:glycosyltransferase [Xanthomonadales bacterium]